MYEPRRASDGMVVWQLLRRAPEAMKNVVTISAYNGHGFLMKNIKRIGATFACNECGARLMFNRNLQCLAKVCSRGETKVRYPEQNSYSRWFYPPKSDGESVLKKFDVVVGERNGGPVGPHSSRVEWARG